MLLCTARNELLEKKPKWGERPGASRIVLTRLSDADAGQVIENLLGQAGLSERARARVIAAAEGNPLFVEQFVSMLIDTGLLHFVNGRWEPTGDLGAIAIPPTIHALLAARLDQLPDDERAVFEPASVVGLVFAQAALQAIVDSDVVGTGPDATCRPSSSGSSCSARRRRTRRRSSTASTHLMIRDATYAGLLKRTRAHLHERFVAGRTTPIARPIARPSSRRSSATTWSRRIATWPSWARSTSTAWSWASTRSGRLASAGRRAFERGDMPATANLLRRAAGTLPSDHAARPRLEFQFGLALWETGQYAAGVAALEAAIAGAAALQDTGLETTARLAILMKQFYADPSKIEGSVEDRVREAIRVLERVGDEEGWRAPGWRSRACGWWTASGAPPRRRSRA